MPITEHDVRLPPNSTGQYVRHARVTVGGTDKGQQVVTPADSAGNEIVVATDRTTAASPFAFRLSDGAAFYDARQVRALTAATDTVTVTGSVSVSNLPATQAVSGTVTADTELTTADMDTGAGTDTRAVVGMVLAESGGGLLVGSAHPLPVSGTFWQATQPVSGPLTDAQLRATAVPVSVSGTATTDVSDRSARLLGHVTVDNASLAVTGTFWQATQPVSGTVTANAGTGTFAVAQSNLSTTDYDTGAGTVTHAMIGVALPASGGPVPVGAANPLPVSDNGGSLTVDGTVAVSSVGGTVTVGNAGTFAVQATLAAGAAAVGTVGVTSVPADPFGANADAIVAAGAVGSIQAKLRRLTQGVEDLKTLLVLAAGANTIGAVNLNAGTNRLGSVRPVDSADADLTTAKGTQTGRFLGTQDAKDSGRVNVCWTVNGVAAAATAEALLTVTESRDGAATTTFTTKVVTSGKRLRLTQLVGYVELTTGTAISRNRIRIRFNTAGAVTTASPAQVVFGLPTVATTTKAAAAFDLVFPDGLEWAGDGTKQIGVTWESPDWASATTVCTLYLTIFGYEY